MVWAWLRGAVQEIQWVRFVRLRLVRISGWLFCSSLLLAADRDCLTRGYFLFRCDFFSYTEITSLLRASVVTAVSQNNQLRIFFTQKRLILEQYIISSRGHMFQGVNFPSIWRAGILRKIYFRTWLSNPTKLLGGRSSHPLPLADTVSVHLNVLSSLPAFWQCSLDLVPTSSSAFILGSPPPRWFHIY